jgi:hypothetical protein
MVDDACFCRELVGRFEVIVDLKGEDVAGDCEILEDDASGCDAWVVPGGRCGSLRLLDK